MWTAPPPLASALAGPPGLDGGQPYLLSLDKLKRSQELTSRLAAPGQWEPGQAGHPFQAWLTNTATHELVSTLDRCEKRSVRIFLQPPERLGLHATSWAREGPRRQGSLLCGMASTALLAGTVKTRC